MPKKAPAKKPAPAGKPMPPWLKGKEGKMPAKKGSCK